MQCRALWVLAPDDVDPGTLRDLAGLGFSLNRHSNAKSLAQALEHGGAEPVQVALLMADVVENCLCAGELADRAPETVVLAQGDPSSLVEQLALLRSGVDWVLARSQPAEDLAMAIGALYRRRLGLLVQRSSQPQRIGSWSLRQDGWLLAHDDGPRMRLSEVERVIVGMLFAAPEHIVSRDMLTAAVLEVWKGGPGSRRRASVNLPLLVGRLRTKGRQLDLRVPVRLVDGRAFAWGA